MKIIFSHIPKCAGSAVKSQIMSRSDFHNDYFNHPTWVNEPDKALGKIKQDKLKGKLSKLNSWIVYGHFSADTYYELNYDIQIMLLRDPLERAISHFYYIKQILPDNEVTRRRHDEVGLIKDNLMCIEQFVALEHVRFFYSNYYLKNINVDERLIVLPINDMEYSLDKIMDVTNIKLDHDVWVNKSEYSGCFEFLRENFLVDTALYKRLINRNVKV